MATTSSARVQLSGVTLETVLSIPSASGENVNVSNKLAVFLHPWAWLGGNMGDYALQVLTETFLAYGYHVVRFNSRGVGNSTGWPSLNGFKEAADLKELVSSFAKDVGNLEKIVIMGYSYGSLIASLHPNVLQVDTRDIPVHHLLLSYPLGPRSLLTFFNGSKYDAALASLCSQSQTKILVVYGTQDQFTSVGKLRKWTESLPHGQSLTVEEVNGANHFWFGEMGNALSQVTSRWLSLIP